MTQNKSFGSKAATFIIYFILTLFGLATLLPYIYVVLCSFGSPDAATAGQFSLLPAQFSLDAYEYIFSTNSLVRSLLVTVFITVVGTLINMLCTILTAYPLSQPNLRGKKTILFLITFTMMFNPGIIPHYMVVKNLHMLNSWWSLLLPNAISAFNLIIMKNFFQQLPYELNEAAKIDGANELYILSKIIIPLALPTVATFSMFYAVTNWNSFMNPLLYINDSTKWPIQILLRQIVLMSSGGAGDSSVALVRIEPQAVKMAVVVVATIPMLVVYPFVQKYFVQGMMVGSVKG